MRIYQVWAGSNWYPRKAPGDFMRAFEGSNALALAGIFAEGAVAGGMDWVNIMVFDTETLTYEPAIEVKPAEASPSD